jgi:hypothetical protein
VGLRLYGSAPASSLSRPMLANGPCSGALPKAVVHTGAACMWCLTADGPCPCDRIMRFDAVKHTYVVTDTSTPHLRGQSRPRIFGAQFVELAGKVCDEAVPDLVVLMEENRKVIGKSLALAELCGRETRGRPLSGKTRCLKTSVCHRTALLPVHRAAEPWVSAVRSAPSAGPLTPRG